MSLTFKGTDSGFGGYDLTDQLLLNLKFWIDWALLHHKAFGSYRLGDESFFSSEESTLTPIFSERFGNGRVYNGVGKEWTWESGVAVSNPPQRVSGVYINGAFYPVGTVGLNSFHVDYQNGRIIFDNTKASTDVIQCEYDHKLVNVANADHQDFRILMENSVITQLTNSMSSGIAPRDNQIHLPAIFIDQRTGSQKGLELGGGQIKKRQISLFVFADTSTDRNLLMDWLDKQSRASFIMADINQMNFPFDQYGDLNAGITNWPDLVNSFPGKKIRIMDGVCRKLDSTNPNIYRGRIDWDVEIDVPGI